MPMSYEKLFALFKDRERNNGVTTYTLRENKQIAQNTLQRLREGKPVNTDTLCMLCYLLKCGLEDIAEYIPDEGDLKK